jgi:hypothetical protein
MEPTAILSKLENLRRTGGGWQARCPAHEDQRSSLSINTGDDGRVLVHCHAGCTVEAVVGKLGLTLTDLMPSNSNGRHQGNGKATIGTIYSYADEHGDLLYQVVRMIPKDFRQRRPAPGGGWTWNLQGVRRVLYRLPELLSADLAETIFVVEGEKDADNLVERRLIATCNSGGADSGRGEKWLREFAQHFRARRVAILPDKDRAGRKHAGTVARSLQGVAAEIKVLELPGTGKDVSDWLGAGGTAEELLRLVEAAPPWKPTSTTAKAIPSWQPFPVEALPEPVRSYLRRSATAIGVDTSYVATALLAALAAAIGNSRLVMLKRGWVEPAVLWGVLVGDSGTLKSPAIDAATKFVRQRQAEAIDIYRQAVEEYERNLGQYKVDLETWKHGSGRKKGELPPEQPTKPVCERFSCSDITVEGLAVLLADAPRGLLLIRDELSGWIGGFDQYRNGRGSDTAHWLTIHGARDLLVDRKTGDKKTTYVRRAAVSIVGGIQPETLRRALGAEHLEDGLAARLLLAMPPRRTKRWTEAEVDQHFDNQIEAVLNRLYGLEFKIGDDGQPEPVTLGLSAAGKVAWIEFYNRHAERLADATGDEAAVLAKIEGAAARIALIVHCVRQVHGGDDQIDDQDVGSGVALAMWYADEAARVYGVLGETDEHRLRRRIVELIERKGGSITANDLRRRTRHFDTSEAAEQFLDELTKAGVGQWGAQAQSEAGGRPTRIFRLTGVVSVSETPKTAEESEVSETGLGENRVIGWSEFDQFIGSADEALVYETPSKPEENEVSVTETAETVGNEWEEIVL